MSLAARGLGARSLRDAAGWMLVAALLLAARGRIDPPWPAGGATPVAAVVCIGVLLLASAARTRLSERTRLRVAAASLALGLLAGGSYLYAYGRFVVSQTKRVADVSRSGELREQTLRAVVGREVRPEVHSAGLSPRELLLRYGFDPERIWTEASLLDARLLLLGSFVGTLATWALGIGLLGAGREAPREKLRVLHVWADPRLLPATAISVQVGRLKLALERFSDRLDYDDQPACSRGDLKERLDSFRPHVLHISCHGDEDGRIVLMHEDSGEPAALAKSELALLLQDRSELRVLVLDCCYGLVDVEPLRGVVAAVVGAKGVIDEPYPIVFSVRLYESLAREKSLDTAVQYAVVAAGDRLDASRTSFELWAPDPEAARLRLLPLV